MNRSRNPWLAALLSVPMQGLGHLYAGRPRAAVAWTAASVVVILVTPWFALHLPSGALGAALVWLLPFGALIGAVVSAALAARAAPTPYVLNRANRWYWYLSYWLSLSAVLQFGVKPAMRRSYQAFRIPSAAMTPTLLIGDFLYAERFTVPPHQVTRGELVVFESVEEAGLMVVKRAIGIPGDTLQMQAGQLYRGGTPVDEPYIRHDSPGKAEPQETRDRMRAWQLPHLVLTDTARYAPEVNNWGPLVVPAESLLVLGDNRDASYDSRYYGFVPFAKVLGTPRLIYYSYDPGAPGFLRALTTIRWNRIGTRFPTAR